MNPFDWFKKFLPKQGGEFGGAGASQSWDNDPRSHPNVVAFLMTIRACEGTRGPNGYRALFGFDEKRQAPCFELFDDHPRKRFSFTQTNGKINWTTAAGAYQFLERTWDEVAAQISAPNFSPEWQDRGAIRRIEFRGAMTALLNGNFYAAIEHCGVEWASLPSSRYPQPKRTFTFARTAYLAAGGHIGEQP